MYARNKMNFINSVGAGLKCSCGELIEKGDAFCGSCGAPVPADTAAAKPPFAAPNFTEPQVVRESVTIPAPVQAAEADEAAAFAMGLPDWSIEPPAVVVRRKGRR